MLSPTKLKRITVLLHEYADLEDVFEKKTEAGVSGTWTIEEKLEKLASSLKELGCKVPNRYPSFGYPMSNGDYIRLFITVFLLNNHVGTSLTPVHYENWLEGGRYYTKFDKVVKTFLTKKVYDIGERLARLDCVLNYKLGNHPRYAGGIDLKAIISK